MEGNKKMLTEAEIMSRFENAIETETDELDFYMELLDNGVTEKIIRDCIGDEAANHMKMFCEEHGLIDHTENINTIDFDKLAIAIIEQWESDRNESGRKELVRGMSYVLNKYTSEHDLEVIDEMLMTFTGYKLESLLKMSKDVSIEG